MSTRRAPMLIALATLAAAAAGATPVPDPLRCQARELRRESDLYQCLSRCDQRAPRAAFPAGSRPVTADAACEDGCVARYADALARLAGAAVCGAVDAPDPARCEARLLRASAVRHACAARCAGRAAAAECAQRCDARCATAAAETSASPICATGRVGSSPLCGEVP